MRATIAVVALYALLLQVFVGNIAGASAQAQAQAQAREFAALCEPSGHDGDPGPRSPCDHCLVSCTPTSGPVPDGFVQSLALADRNATSVPVRDLCLDAPSPRTRGIANGARAPPSA